MTEPLVLRMLRAECRKHQATGVDAMTMSVEAVLFLFDQRDAERSRADAAEAERDAAVAPAMPAPRLMRTVEEVEALPSGCYLLALGHNDHPGMIRVHLGRFYERTREIGGHDLVGHTLLGPLPDLPTPTAAQEATDAP